MMHPLADKPVASTAAQSMTSGLSASGCIISLIPQPGVQSSPMILVTPTVVADKGLIYSSLIPRQNIKSPALAIRVKPLSYI